jgi:hypothetical protein
MAIVEPWLAHPIAGFDHPARAGFLNLLGAGVAGNATTIRTFYRHVGQVTHHMNQVTHHMKVSKRSNCGDTTAEWHLHVASATECCRLPKQSSRSAGPVEPGRWCSIQRRNIGPGTATEILVFHPRARPFQPAQPDRNLFLNCAEEGSDTQRFLESRCRRRAPSGFSILLGNHCPAL